MNNPFSPGGEFVKNIRAAKGDDTELRESLKAFGWVKEFPALCDENGVVLVGNRRVKIARELGIEPVMELINFGKGDAADAERFKLAIASNIGFQQMTADDRKRIARHLYGTQEWTMQRIADALSVGKGTVSKDLRGIVSTGNNSKSASNPKGAGRPKGNLKPERRINETPKAAAAAKEVLDKGKTYSEVEAETGLSSTVLRSAIAREEGRREATAIEPAEMPHTMAQRYEATLKRARAELREEITAEVHADYLSMVERYRQRVADADRIIASHRGIFSRQDFRKIKACLHPDHNSFQFAAEALRLFSEYENVLIKPEPTRNPNTPPLPSFAEMMRMRDKVTAERKAARAAQKAKREAQQEGAAAVTP